MPPLDFRAVSTESATVPGKGPDGSPRTTQEVSPRMFENPVLEWGSRVHPIVPPLLYLPLIVFLTARSIVHYDLSVPAVAGVFIAGIAAWSLGEYTLHRFVFHLQPDTTWGRRLHFIIHGVHHHYRSNNRLSLALRRYHYRHHFQQSDRGFGVTSPLWDKVFRTVPIVRRR